MRIGLAYNIKHTDKPIIEREAEAEFDSQETIDAIRSAIESGGHTVVLLESNLDFVENLKRSKVDFVFNIAEGLRGESRESHIPAILEMFGVPYSGSGPLTQAITLNKARKKEILGYYGISTPEFQLVTPQDPKIKGRIKFPVIVKPNCEGSSKGITDDCLVHDPKALKKKVDQLLKKFKEGVLIERYLEGREFTVGIIGNKKPIVLPIVEVTFDYLPKNVNRFDSYEVKWIYDNPDNPIDPLKCPAPLTPKLKKAIEKVALDTYRALGCVDLTRMDLRLDENGVPNVLDVNALPGLIPDPKENSRFPRACFKYGWTYVQMVLYILNAGLSRYGFIDEVY